MIRGSLIRTGGGPAKRMPRILAAAPVCTAAIALSSCSGARDDTLVLRIANCEEYIDEGGWDEDESFTLSDGTLIYGERSLVADFEEWYEATYGEPIRVEYSTYGTNEDLYNQMSLGDVFDLVCPSEYMILKLMEEERLQPYSEDFFEEAIPENYYVRNVSPYISDVFDELSTGGESVTRYGAGYMWGTLGIVYNPEVISEERASHYAVLTDSDYYKQITMKDSIRDSYFAGLAILRESEISEESYRDASDYRERLSEMMNDTSQETVLAVQDILSDMRDNAYSLETDSGKADLVTGKVIANLQWSGDAVYTMDQAEEDEVYLAYAVPEECGNLWFDGWVMMRNGIDGDAKRQQAAEAFVNFISRPDNAVRNMYVIGYTSTIAGEPDGAVREYIEECYGSDGDEDAVPYDISYFYGEPAGSVVLPVDSGQLARQLYAQYPTAEVLDRCVVMRCFDTEANERIAQMWTDIRCFSLW